MTAARHRIAPRMGAERLSLKACHRPPGKAPRLYEEKTLRYCRKRSGGRGGKEPLQERIFHIVCEIVSRMQSWAPTWPFGASLE